MCFESCCLPMPVAYDTWTPPLYIPAPSPMSIPTTIYGRTIPGYGLRGGPVYRPPSPVLRGRLASITPGHNVHAMPGSRVFNAPREVPTRNFHPGQVSMGANSGNRVAVGRR